MHITFFSASVGMGSEIEDIHSTVCMSDAGHTQLSSFSICIFTPPFESSQI
jgi:hypothetical protein